MIKLHSNREQTLGMDKHDNGVAVATSVQKVGLINFADGLFLWSLKTRNPWYNPWYKFGQTWQRCCCRYLCPKVGLIILADGLFLLSLKTRKPWTNLTTVLLVEKYTFQINFFKNPGKQRLS